MTAFLAAPLHAQPAEARAGALPLQARSPDQPRNRLRYAPIETDREHLSVGIAPPGARRALLGLHYRLRLGDRRAPVRPPTGI